MKRELILSKRASFKLQKLFEYLDNEWSVNIRKSFVKKLDKSFDQILKYPESCKKINLERNLHRMVITKQTSIIYRFNLKTVTVVTVFDNRMNPEKISNELT